MKHKIKLLKLYWDILSLMDSAWIYLSLLNSVRSPRGLVAYSRFRCSASSSGSYHWIDKPFPVLPSIREKPGLITSYQPVWLPGERNTCRIQSWVCMGKQSLMHIFSQMHHVVIPPLKEFREMWMYLYAQLLPPSDGMSALFSEPCMSVSFLLTKPLLQWFHTTSLSRRAQNMTPALTAECTSSSWVLRKCRRRGCGWIYQKKKMSLQMAL